MGLLLETVFKKLIFNEMQKEKKIVVSGSTQCGICCTVNFATMDELKSRSVTYAKPRRKTHLENICTLKRNTLSTLVYSSSSSASLFGTRWFVPALFSF
jgi:hypothetical protein